MMQREAALDYLNNLHRYEKIKLGLETMQSLMAALGNPQNQFTSLHVAGTNGKGSVAAFLANTLLTTPTPPAGGLSTRKIGLYTSPYLQRFNERIQIAGRSISNKELAQTIAAVRRAAEQHHLQPSYFEFATALAFCYFAQQQIEAAVIEVGMGGDLDATNVITPAVSIITNIGRDHTQWLGKTPLAIARRKAGIIKKNVPLVTAETNPQILEYFAHVCREKNTTMHVVQQELPAEILQQSLDGQAFKTTGVMTDTFKITLLGEHQVVNACTALLALLALSPLPSQGDLPAELAGSRVRGIKRGLAQTHWPGRLQIISRNPFILLDGAHNPEGIAALVKFLRTNLCPQPDVLVIGIKGDKDAAMLADLVPLFRKIIVTEANFQPMRAAQLARKLTAFLPLPEGEREGVGAKAPSIQAIPNLKLALATAQQELESGKMLLITGSLYLIGDALTILQ
ncbi:MAG TPA: folylpolyglutamate synthase/dihydrofolate synthase family protein [Candidatus Andersenbacteria bacterium]|nr:folylpolyglutamate synthase/dihydrofolate synthase family protein [Candidatus Andersenbacteria bacterium]